MCHIACDHLTRLWSACITHLLAWRRTLEERGLSTPTIRRKLSALSSLFAHLCDSNAVTHNPVLGVKPPRAETAEGKTPALGDAYHDLM